MLVLQIRSVHLPQDAPVGLSPARPRHLPRRVFGIFLPCCTFWSIDQPMVMAASTPNSAGAIVFLAAQVSATQFVICCVRQRTVSRLAEAHSCIHLDVNPQVPSINRTAYMLIETQLNASMAQLVTRIKHMPNVMLTGLDETNTLKSRPMAPIGVDRLGAIWFFADLRSATVKRLALLHLNFAETATSSYVSISGHGELDVERQHIAQLWNSSSIRWFPDGPTSANLALLKFIPEQAEYWDGAQNRMVRLLAPASSYVSGNHSPRIRRDRPTKPPERIVVRQGNTAVVQS